MPIDDERKRELSDRALQNGEAQSQMARQLWALPSGVAVENQIIAMSARVGENLNPVAKVDRLY